MGLRGWERAGAMGANGAFSLLTRYRALASQRMVILGSGSLGLGTAALALQHGVNVAGIVEVDEAASGEGQAAAELGDRGGAIYTTHIRRELAATRAQDEFVDVV